MANDDKTSVKPYYGQLAFTANRFVLSHMRRIRQNFALELDRAFILGSLAHLNVYHGLNPLLPKEMLITRNEEHLFMPARLRDVVNVTGLPRETVRRHLLSMAHQPIAGEWRISSCSVTPEMMDETMSTVKNLLKTADELHGILDRAGVDYRQL